MNLIVELYTKLLNLIPLEPVKIVTNILIPTLAVIVVILFNVFILIWWERRLIAFIQVRLGPNRLGPAGLIQTFADALKVMLKEHIIPKNVNIILFALAPIVMFAPGLIVYTFIPMGQGFIVSDLKVGIFIILAIASLTTLGILMAGWASNNKYSLIGGMRVVAQAISYEIPLLLSMVGIILLTGSMSTVDIVEKQNIWNIITQPLAFLIFFICALAEVNRIPFDLPEAESELVSGFNTEYSGFMFASFFLAEYVNTFTLGALGATLFLGGWRFPLDFLLGDVGIQLTAQLGFLWFYIKAMFFFSMVIWVRGTLPRVRMDQLMGFAWKYLIPLVLLNIFVTGTVAAWFQGFFKV